MNYSLEYFRLKYMNLRLIIYLNIIRKTISHSFFFFAFANVKFFMFILYNEKKCKEIFAAFLLYIFPNSDSGMTFQNGNFISHCSQQRRYHQHLTSVSCTFSNVSFLRQYGRKTNLEQTSTLFVIFISNSNIFKCYYKS